MIWNIFFAVGSLTANTGAWAGAARGGGLKRGLRSAWLSRDWMNGRHGFKRRGLELDREIRIVLQYQSVEQGTRPKSHNGLLSLAKLQPCGQIKSCC
jgi:hypothetical protein